MSLREWALDEAKKCVCSDRNEQYGDPEDNFEEIAKYWTTYLGTEVNSVDVAMMMCLFKIARITGSSYASTDSFVDLIGYAACGLECRGMNNDGNILKGLIREIARTEQKETSNETA